MCWSLVCHNTDRSTSLFCHWTCRTATSNMRLQEPSPPRAWYWPWAPPRRRTAPPRWSAPAAAPGCGRQRCSWRTYNDPHVNTPTLKLWLIVDESLSSCKRLVKELRTQTLSQQLLTLLLALVNRYTSRIGLEEWLKISQIQRPKTLAIWTRFLKYYDYQNIKG